jgi:hypothetical protein
MELTKTAHSHTATGYFALPAALQLFIYSFTHKLIATTLDGQAGVVADSLPFVFPFFLWLLRIELPGSTKDGIV